MSARSSWLNHVSYQKIMQPYLPHASEKTSGRKNVQKRRFQFISYFAQVPKLTYISYILDLHIVEASRLIGVGCNVGYVCGILYKQDVFIRLCIQTYVNNFPAGMFLNRVGKSKHVIYFIYLQTSSGMHNILFPFRFSFITNLFYDSTFHRLHDLHHF